MYPGSLPLIFNGSVPGHEKLFNVRRCSMYTGVQFDRFHCIYIKSCTQSSLVARLGKRQRYSRSVPKTNWKWGKHASPVRL